MHVGNLHSYCFNKGPVARHSIAGDTALKTGHGNPSVPSVAALRHSLAARTLSLQLAGALPIVRTFIPLQPQLLAVFHPSSLLFTALHFLQFLPFVISCLLSSSEVSDFCSLWATSPVTLLLPLSCYRLCLKLGTRGDIHFLCQLLHPLYQ